MNKFVMTIMIMAFWIFVPAFMLAINVPGFSQANPELVTGFADIEFNVLTLEGATLMLEIMAKLAVYTITGMGWFFNALFFFMSMSSVIIGLFWIRGTD